MEYLLLAVIIIIIYAEIIPTISIFFELIRTWISSKTLIIQQNTVHIQEDIQNTTERIHSETVPVIGFQPPTEEYEERDDESWEEE